VPLPGARPDDVRGHIAVTGSRLRRSPQAGSRLWLFAAAIGTVSILAGPIDVPALPPGFQEVIAFQGLTDPTAVRFSPDGRVFVAEKSGLVKVFDSLGDVTPTILADLRSNVHSFWDRGLLGLAVHPDFPGTPYIYVLYTYDYDPLDPAHPAPRYGDTCPDRNAAGDIIGPGAMADGCVVNARLSRLRVNPDNTLDGGEQVLLENRWCQQFPTHSIGSIVFGPEGALYLSAGDGANFDFEDWGQMGGTRPDVALPTPVNACGDPDSPRGTATTKPTAAGGALRAQSVRNQSVQKSLDGAILRLDPGTGAAWPTNPLIGGPTTEDDPIIAYGLRNPFRMSSRAGTSEVWVGDVGLYHWEEINRIDNPDDAVVENFGWPCLEGPDRLFGYNGDPPDNLDLCTTLATGDTMAAYYQFHHDQPLYNGDTCDTASGSSISGLAFYSGGNYPAAYNGALFFADYNRNCVWVMTTPSPGVGDPDIGARAVFLGGNVDALQLGDPDPVDLQIGPGGDLFLVDLDDGMIRRITHNIGNNPPTANIQATPTNGPVPLSVQFDGSGSTDPDPGATLFYAWDLDGDGEYDDAFLPQTTREYASVGTITVGLRVTDDDNASSTSTATITAGNSAPTASIEAPLSTRTWRVGDAISFSGQGSDTDDGALGPAAMQWEVVLRHCPNGPGTCHSHVIQTYEGIQNGAFTAPDHSYYSELEFTLSVTDSGGLGATDTVTIAPEAVFNTYESTPPGAALSVSGLEGVTSFTRGSIVGSLTSLIAVSPQIIDGVNQRFVSWNDGGSGSRTFVAGDTPRTFHATFTICQVSESECDDIDGDCDGSVDNVPPPAGAPSVGMDGTGLSWPSLQGAVTYDVLRSHLASSPGTGFQVGTEVCIASRISGTSFADSATPLMGEAFWYFVRGNSCAEVGTWDAGDAGQVGSLDASINGAPGACP
jgi:glucose/arabinose dehydrogenase